jgi:3'-5' exoribonuclease
MIWEDSQYYRPCDETWKVGDFFKIQAQFIDHKQFGPQIEVIKMRLVEDRDKDDGFNVDDFTLTSKREQSELVTELLGLIENSIIDEPLRRLTAKIIAKYADQLKVLPAHPRAFYAYPGGWFEHVLSVTKTCIWLADFYKASYANLKPALNKDLIVAGAVLHDVGRALELIPTGPLNETTEYTIDGRLFGHIQLSQDIVRAEAAALGDVNPELVKLLEHLILSHLTVPEWGSPRLPMIPEVLILHHADDLDAKMEMYARCLGNDLGAGPFTERDPVLNKPLLKARTV